MAISTAVDPSAVARVIGVQTRFRDLRTIASLFLPQRIAVVGQGSDAATYATEPVQIFDANTAGTLYGFGSPVHLAAKQLLPVNGDGVGALPVTIYPLEAAGGAVAATGDITPAGAQVNTASYQVRIGGVLSQNISIPAGTAAAAAAALIVTAINAVIDMPVTAVDNVGVVELTAKWSGASGNNITVQVLGTPDGIAFAVTQPAGGASNPDVDTALANIGNIWETMLVNCFDSADSTTLDKFESWGNGRLNPLVNKTPIVFSGSSDTLANLTVIGNARTEDRINSLIPVQGSPNMDLQIAARAVSRIAVLANNNPPNDYAGLELSGILPGATSDEWTYAQRDTAVKAGISTVEIIDGAPQLSDTVTFYHPTGEEPPAFRYVVDIVKLMNMQFATQVTFSSDEWKGVPLLDDDDVTINPTAKKPKDAITSLASIIRGFGLNALIANVDDALSSIQAEIDSGNPKRLNASYTVQLSGNANIISTDLNFGFFFGGSN